MEENQQKDTNVAAAPAAPAMPPAGSPAEQPQPQGTWFKKPIIIAAAVIVLLAAGAGIAYAAYYSPAKVWARFTARTVPKVTSQTFSFSYTDNGKLPADMANNPEFAMFSNLKISLSGTSYTDISDAANMQASSDLDYSFGAGGTSISSKAQLAIKGKDIYLNLGDNPVVNSILSYMSPDQKITWLKINTTEIEQATGMGASSTPASRDFSQQVKDMQAIIFKYTSKIVTMDKFIDKQEVRGVQTLHFSAKLNKEELKNLAKEALALSLKDAESQKSMTPEALAKATETANKIVASLADRLEVHSLEVWVGQKDNQLYRLKFSSNAPSLISLALVAAEPMPMDADPEKVVDTVLQKLTFDGTIESQQEYFDFGKVQDVKTPDNAFDVAKKIRDENELQRRMMTDPSASFPNGIK